MAGPKQSRGSSLSESNGPTTEHFNTQMRQDIHSFFYLQRQMHQNAFQVPPWSRPHPAPSIPTRVRSAIQLLSHGNSRAQQMTKPPPEQRHVTFRSHRHVPDFCWDMCSRRRGRVHYRDRVHDDTTFRIALLTLGRVWAVRSSTL